MLENLKLTAPKFWEETDVLYVLSTVQQQLAEKKLKGQIAAKKSFISKKNKTKNMDFAQTPRVNTWRLDKSFVDEQIKIKSM